MMWTSFLFSMALLVAFGHAQVATVVDPAIGDTVAVTYSTDSLGQTQATLVLSTLLPSSTTPVPSLTPPLSTGTAQPPFPSRSVVSGSIIQYSQFTATGFPTSSATPSSGAVSNLRPANLRLASAGAITSVFVALLGGGGVLWAFL